MNHDEALITYDAVEINDSGRLPDSRIEIDGTSAWFHLTAGEATWLQEQMAAAEMTADELGSDGAGTGEMIEGHHWAIASDAAWTMIVDREADVDVLCQVLHDGQVENVRVHSDDTGN
jgi:hypothetical protein